MSTPSEIGYILTGQGNLVRLAWFKSSIPESAFRGGAQISRDASGTYRVMTLVATHDAALLDHPTPANDAWSRLPPCA